MVEIYAQWLLDGGLEEGAEMVVIPERVDEVNYGKVQFIGGGHRMEAFYLAWSRFPNNPFVVEIIENGFPPATALDPRTPDDIARHFAENGYWGSGSTSDT